MGEVKTAQVVPWYIGRNSYERWARRERAKLDPPTKPEDQQQLVIDTLTLCRDNPAFLLHEFGQITPKGGGRVSFNDWTPAQRKLYAVVVGQYIEGKPVRVVILKARQMGISTLCQGLLFWRTAFFPDARSIIVAHEEDAATNLYGMFRLFYDSLPEVIRPSLRLSNATEMVFDNPDVKTRADKPGLNSRVMTRTVALGGASKANQGKGRSFAFQGAHFSEAGYWAEPDRFWNGISQCLPSVPHTWALIESTANEFGNWFHAFWRRAARGWAIAPDEATGLPVWRCTDPAAATSGYLPVFLTYLEHPEYRIVPPFKPGDVVGEHRYRRSFDAEEKQLVEVYGASLDQVEWRRRTIADRCSGDIEVFHKEYPLTPEQAFQASGRQVFDMHVLTRRQDELLAAGDLPQRGEVSPEGTFAGSDTGPVQVFKEPVDTHAYVLGVDGSYGKVDGDYSCVQVIDRTTWEQVAVGHGTLDAEATAAVAAGLARLYHGDAEQALAVVELDGPGLHILGRMQDYGHWNFYRRLQFDAQSKKPQSVLGWVSSTRARDRMVQVTKAAVKDGSLTLYDPETIREMMQWVVVTNVNSGKAKEQPADPTHGHDDRVTALGAALTGGCVEEGIGGIVASKKAGTPLGKAPARYVIGSDFGLTATGHDVLGECY